MAKEMLINVAEREECRVAVIDNGSLEELYIERASVISRVGNIYKGKVVNIESSIQAAFIDFGVGKNGFLHISDLHPRYFPKSKQNKTEVMGRRKALKERIPIQKCLRKGQKLVVQVTKEGINTKGPTLSTYLSLPGKYLVMMPWLRKHGISHKIEDDQERARLHKLLEECKLPKSQGFIIRTAGAGCSKREILSDLRYLVRLWVVINKRIENDKITGMIYHESDLVIRTLRDVFNSNISKILCDSESVVRKIKDFLSIATPRLKRRAVFYDSKVPLFHKYKLEDKIAQVQSRTVGLKGGGSIVLEQTEALVAVDVNSGRYRDQRNAEQTAFKINIEAAGEIARQLRLRDLGGLIICDFIDMRNDKHNKELEKTFRAAVKADRARTKILRLSRFGIIEMTRQRMRPSLQSATYLSCPHCDGIGSVKSTESLSIEIIRLLQLSASKDRIKRVELYVSPEVADYLHNKKRAGIAQIELQSGKTIEIHSQSSLIEEKRKLVCYNERGSIVKL